MSKYTIVYNLFPEEIYNLIIDFDGGIKNDFNPVIKEMNATNYTNRGSIKMISLEPESIDFDNKDVYFKIYQQSEFKRNYPWNPKDNLIIEYNIYDNETYTPDLVDWENGLVSSNYFTYTNETNYNKFYFDRRFNHNIFLKMKDTNEPAYCNYESDTSSSDSDDYERYEKCYSDCSSSESEYLDSDSD